MRIIDLFNKLMNGEDMPEKIRTISDNKEYTYDKSSSDYLDEKENYLFEIICDFMDTKTFLKEEIEIIEERR